MVLVVTGPALSRRGEIERRRRGRRQARVSILVRMNQGGGLDVEGAMNVMRGREGAVHGMRQLRHVERAVEHHHVVELGTELGLESGATSTARNQHAYSKFGRLGRGGAETHRAPTREVATRGARAARIAREGGAIGRERWRVGDVVELVHDREKDVLRRVGVGICGSTANDLLVDRVHRGVCIERERRQRSTYARR